MALLALAGCGAGKKRAAVAKDAGVSGPLAGPTARPLDADAITALAAVTIATYRVEVVRRGPDFGAVIRAGTVAATVTVSPCLSCTPVDATRWEAERSSLAAMFAPAPEDRLTIAVVEHAGQPMIEVRARRTLEGVGEAVVLGLWNDGKQQLIASCEQAGGDEAERACSELVEASALSYLPVLAPPG